MFLKSSVLLVVGLFVSALWGQTEIDYGYLKENESLKILKGEVLSIVGYSAVSRGANAFMLTLEDESDVFFPVESLGNTIAMNVLDPLGEVPTKALADLATEAARKEGLHNTRFERLQEVAGEVSFVRYVNGRVNGKYSEKQIRKRIAQSNLNPQSIVGPCRLKNYMSYLSYKIHKQP